MEQRKKITIIILVILTLLLGVGSLIITQLIRNNQAPTDSAASGFGPDASRDKFDIVAEAFQFTNCSAYFPQEIVSSTIENAKEGNDRYSDLNGSDFEVWRSRDYTQIPKYCEYVINNKMLIEFKLYSYTSNSVIDNSAEELYERVNTQTISKIVTEQTDFDDQIVYFYGYGIPNNGGNCVLNFFHKQNDFEYGQITFNGNTECTFDKDLFEELSKNAMSFTRETFKVFEI